MLGGLVGAYLAIQYIPGAWQTQFGALSQGVKPGVSLRAGVACEAALAFLLNLVILYSLSGRPLALQHGFVPRCRSCWEGMHAFSSACRRCAGTRRKVLGALAPLVVTIVLVRGLHRHFVSDQGLPGRSSRAA